MRDTNIGRGRDILRRILVTQEIRPRVDRWDLMKLKMLLYSKGDCQFSEEEACEMGIILASYLSDRRLMSTTHRSQNSKHEENDPIK